MWSNRNFHTSTDVAKSFSEVILLILVAGIQIRAAIFLSHL